MTAIFLQGNALTVLRELPADPFAGAGTTALVADQLGRDSVSIDTSEKYVQMSQERLEQDRTKRNEEAKRRTEREHRTANRNIFLP